MDRNRSNGAAKVQDLVALRKESVDRNSSGRLVTRKYVPSLSARRAWIEIIEYEKDNSTGTSLSARRAWIEILAIRAALARPCVALRKESVDRNSYARF